MKYRIIKNGSRVMFNKTYQSFGEAMNDLDYYLRGKKQEVVYETEVS